MEVRGVRTRTQECAGDTIQSNTLNYHSPSEIQEGRASTANPLPRLGPREGRQSFAWPWSEIPFPSFLSTAGHLFNQPLSQASLWQGRHSRARGLGWHPSFSTHWLVYPWACHLMSASVFFSVHWDNDSPHVIGFCEDEKANMRQGHNKVSVC